MNRRSLNPNINHFIIINEDYLDFALIGIS